MAGPNRSLRALWILATGFLGLDGILLVIAGRLQGRTSLIVWGVVLAAVGVAVARSWWSYQVKLQEFEQVRHSVRADIEELREVVKHSDSSA